MSVSTAEQDLGQKYCPGCGLTKTRPSFSRNARCKDGLQVYCKDCARARRERDREKIRAYLRRYYRDHREELLAKMRARYAANPEPIRRAALAYQEAHPEERRLYKHGWYMANKPRLRLRQRQRAPHINAQLRVRRAANPEPRRARGRADYRKHRGRYIARARKRDIQAKGAQGSYTKHDERMMYEAQCGRCAYCLAPLDGVYDVDHMTPLSRQGSNWPWNLCLACEPCNTRKHTMDAGAFFALLIREHRTTKTVTPS